jgi:outer membrane protein OmpU
MKKILLATAAVMALTASAAQAEVNLDLGGFFKGYAGYADQDTDNLRGFDFKRKSEIHFTGETTLDNGLTVGYKGELMQDMEEDLSANGGEFGGEESYVYFSGNWGRVNAGRGNGAAYLLQVTAPGADANIDGQDIDFSFFNNGTTSREDYQQSGPDADAQYSDKIVYMTPKFNGFQAGVSYSPRYETLERDTMLGGMEADNTTGDLENMMELAARYDGEFNGLGLHLGAGYTNASPEVDVANVNNFGSEDWKEWNAAVKFTYNAFGFGGAYITDNNAREADNRDTDTWTVGADYTWGAYVFGANYFNSQDENGTGVAEDELDRWTVGATYTFGPGMDFRGAVASYDTENNGASSNDATVVTLGTDIQF